MGPLTMGVGQQPLFIHFSFSYILEVYKMRRFLFSSLSFDSGEIHHTISTRPPHIGALLSLPGTPVMRTERHDDKDDSATTRRPDRQTHHAK
jgi:hypothetical protein